MSRPDEPERDFRVRLQQLARERRDEAAERLRQAYAPKLAALEERLRGAEQVKGREEEHAAQQHVQTAISIGATLLSAFLGRKRVSATSLGRATTAARGAGRSIKKTQDVARAGENVEAIRKQLSTLEAQLQVETDALVKEDALAGPLETIAIRPAKSGIAVKLVALAWAPSWDSLPQ